MEIILNNESCEFVVEILLHKSKVPKGRRNSCEKRKRRDQRHC